MPNTERPSTQRPHTHTSGTEAPESEREGTGGGLAASIARKAIEPLVRVIHEEVASARREIGARIAGARTGVILLVVAALFAVLTLLLLSALAVVLLALALPLWAAIAITLAGAFAISLVFFAVGLRLVRRGIPPVPHDTFDEIHDRIIRS